MDYKGGSMGLVFFYYRLFELKNGDGNFVGMDKNKCIYLIIQDPYSIIEYDIGGSILSKVVIF